VSDIQRDELERRLGEEALVVLDVRSPGEFSGVSGYPCDSRQGHLPGARNVDLQLLLEASDPAAIKALVGAPEGAEIVAYCHSGGRSAMATHILGAAGYDARNYVGSWHEWSSSSDLPIER
jgi:thiosulfate/3-mercaptopyruvate sulfurtransferase